MRGTDQGGPGGLHQNGHPGLQGRASMSGGHAVQPGITIGGAPARLLAFQCPAGSGFLVEIAVTIHDGTTFVFRIPGPGRDQSHRPRRLPRIPHRTPALAVKGSPTRTTQPRGPHTGITAGRARRRFRWNAEPGYRAALAAAHVVLGLPGRDFRLCRGAVQLTIKFCRMSADPGNLQCRQPAVGTIPPGRSRSRCAGSGQVS